MTTKIDIMRLLDERSVSVVLSWPWPFHLVSYGDGAPGPCVKENVLAISPDFAHFGVSVGVISWAWESEGRRGGKEESGGE